MKPVVAVVAQGAMGAGIAGRLTAHGLRVVTSLAGRSAASAARARAAGMVAVGDEALAQADCFLSILPPGEAMALAERMAGPIAAAGRAPLYVDCNAVSPPTKIAIGRVIERAGARFVDAGIIGGPPRAGSDGPRFYAAGPAAEEFAALAAFGLVVDVMRGPVGAAAAMKMSYAGITKGFTALGAMMLLAATRGGVAAGLRAELARSQPALLAWLAETVPAVYPKAYRYVGEMEEIAAYVGEDRAAADTFAAFADFYTRLAADQAGAKAEVNALAAFLAPAR